MQFVSDESKLIGEQINANNNNSNFNSNFNLILHF